MLAQTALPNEQAQPKGSRRHVLRRHFQPDEGRSLEALLLLLGRNNGQKVAPRKGLAAEREAKEGELSDVNYNTLWASIRAAYR